MSIYIEGERKHKIVYPYTQESFDNLMKMVKDGYEVHITYEPDRVEVEVMPWKPFEYRCPYQMAQKEEEKINADANTR